MRLGREGGPYLSIFFFHQMETTIKQSEDDRNKSLNQARHLINEFLPLKERLDMLRGDLGLERMPGLEADDIRLSNE